MLESDHSHPEFEVLIKQAQGRLRHYIFAIFPNHTACDDILQETNKVLWEKQANFEPGTNFLAWARTIARFQTLSFLKNSKRKSWLSFDSELVVSLASVVESQDDAREAKSAALRGCMGKLSEADRELISLRYTSKNTLKEVGHSVSRTEGALKQAFARIRNQLKICIERSIFKGQNQVTENQDHSNLINKETSN